MQNSERKLKILIPILTFGKEGGFRVLAQLANNWSDMGHDVAIVSYYENNSPYFPTNAKIYWIDDEGKEHATNKNEFDIKGSAFTRAKSLFRFLKKYAQNFDVVLANQNLSAWPVALGSKSMNFYYIQAYEPSFYKNIMKKGIAWLTYFLPLFKIVNADIYKIYKNIRSNIVIPPGLDLETYYPKILQKIENEKIVVGCIGRKEEWKGSNDVGEAIKILRSKGYNVKFKVAFEPIKYSDHELVFPDGDSNLADFYRSLDVLVAPGHIQLGAVHYPVIEAMACKVPVITTGYYPANNENSFIVPIKRPDIIADTLIEIIENYESAIKKTEIAHNTISQFDWKVVSAKFLNVFNDGLRR